jgi:hypothetical protein
LQGINVTFDEVGGIVECLNIDKGPQLLQGGQSGKDVVRYVQRPWGVHIDMVRNRRSKGMDRCPLTIWPIITIQLWGLVQILHHYGILNLSLPYILSLT